uniref:DUF6570 domain-containing protein n=1 Tax=Amphimedon queenslandica TaxID=400682 RepID=A0A1X7VA88_AMPQE
MLFSKDNNINPGTVTTQLQGLSQAEEMLISAIFTMICIYKLPHEQYGYSRHVINFHQDVQTSATSLPRLAADISVLVIRMEKEQIHRYFHVRRQVVEEALTWRMVNNILYLRHSVC